MKKMIAVILALVLILSLASIAYAATAPITKDQYYARSTLKGNELKYYDDLYTAIQKGQGVDNSNYDISDIRARQIVYYLYEDAPELIDPYSMYSNSEEKAMKQQLDQIAEGILNSQINDTMTDYEKLKALYIYLGKNIEYDGSVSKELNTGKIKTKEAADSQTAYGGLVNKKAVCGGIACTLQYLLYREGIQCYAVTGTSSGIDHSWDIIKIDGQWYYADLSNDLQRIQTDQNLEYFLFGDYKMQLAYTLTEEDGVNYNPTLPECPSQYAILEVTATPESTSTPVANGTSQATSTPAPSYIEHELGTPAVTAAAAATEGATGSDAGIGTPVFWSALAGIVVLGIVIFLIVRKNKKNKTGN